MPSDRQTAGEQQSTNTRFVDELDPIFDAIESANPEADTTREKMALARLQAALEYARKVGLQREFPTPNQQLYAHVSGAELEQPEDPGTWEEFIEQHGALQDMEDWADE